MEQTEPPSPAQPSAEALARMRDDSAQKETDDAVADLRRCREFLMEHLELSWREAKGLLRTEERANCVNGIDPGFKAVRLARAVRQVIAQQQELMGLRPVPGIRVAVAAPAAETSEQPTVERNDAREASDLRDREYDDLRDRSDLDDYDDYDNRPYEQVMASIHDDLRRISKPRPVETEPARKAAIVPVNAEMRLREELLTSAAAPAPHRRERGPP
jgi:hypothetical protein